MRQDKKKNSIFKWSVIGFALSVMISLPAFVLTSCSDNPLSTTNDRNKFFDQPYSESVTDELPGNALFKTLVGVETYTGEGPISQSDGGSIDVAGKFVFRVAPGSITANTVISVEITRFTYDDETIILHKFLPDGLQFATSAYLEFSVDLFDYSSDEDTKLYWLNAETNHWDWVSDFDNSMRMVSIPIDHFSMYGVE